MDISDIVQEAVGFTPKVKNVAVSAYITVPLLLYGAPANATDPFSVDREGQIPGFLAGAGAILFGLGISDVRRGNKKGYIRILLGVGTSIGLIYNLTH